MKQKKNAKRIIAVVLALLTMCSCMGLQTYAQDEEDPQDAPQVLWAHLYKKYDTVYLIGRMEKTYDNVMPSLDGGLVYKYFLSADICYRTKDGGENTLEVSGMGYQDYFVFGLNALPSAEAKDPTQIQSVTLRFPQDSFAADSPAFEYTTDDLVTNVPVLDRTGHTIPCACDGRKIYASCRLDEFMYMPLQTDPDMLSNVSFSFGSARILPTRYSYDGETLAIERLGAISDYSQLRIEEKEKVVLRSFKLIYKDASVEAALEIEASDTLLVQQRRIMWLYLLFGGIFVKAARRFFAWF